MQQAAAELPPQPFKMEVGIEDCLHIEFEYNRQKYHLRVKIEFDICRILIYNRC